MSQTSYPFDGDVHIHRLRPFVLAFDGDSRRQMRDSDGGTGGVDGLTTRTRRLQVGKLEVFRRKFDLRIRNRRRHDYNACRGLKLTFLFGQWNSGEEEGGEGVL